MDTSQVISAPSKKSSKLKKALLLVIAFLLVAGIGGKVWFPFGHSHACSKGLGFALSMYAEDHDGWLPHGEGTPEASLALFAKDDIDSALWVLGGKNIPRPLVQASLTNAGAFGPDTCGWHYVEGLREDDDPEIMVAWDKVVGLGHNGERRSSLMHEVLFLDGSSRFITKKKWPQFVAAEKEKLAKMIASRQPNTPPIRWSDEVTLGSNRFPVPTR
jgi:hypothetical protein